MDIKTGIDGLNEAEAKAALFELVEDISNFSPCYDQCGGDCPHWLVCGNYKRCAEVWLEEALKEARK